MSVNLCYVTHPSVHMCVVFLKKHRNTRLVTYFLNIIYIYTFQLVFIVYNVEMFLCGGFPVSHTLKYK